MKTQTQSNAGAKPASKKTETKPHKRATAQKEERWSFPYDKKNFIIAAIGLGVILLGYILMYTGVTESPAIPDGKWNNPFAVVVAPILLLIGYCVIIPYSLMKLFVKK